MFSMSVAPITYDDSLKLTWVMPDPLLMNAFNTVNLSSACILTTTEFAKQLQIPERKWIYPLGGAGFQERDRCKFAYYWREKQDCSHTCSSLCSVWERPNLFQSAAISKSLDACLRRTQLAPENIDLYDFYSYVFYRRYYT